MEILRPFKIMLKIRAIDNTARLSAESSIPVSEADCRICPDPCDQGHQEYPNKFDVDMDSRMLGSVKPFRRQVVISTGKTDWDKEVTEAQGTLAAYLLQVQKGSSKAQGTEEEENPPSGLFNSSESTRIAILNGSHYTLSEECDRETVLVFPDYKAVVGIPHSLQGAQDLWDGAVDPALGRLGLEKRPFRSWILPYSCVIMLCSHKRRDNRCSVAAPKLLSTFTQSLEQKGWEVYNQVEDTSLISFPLEDLKGTQEDKETQIVDRLKTLPSQKKALILRNSHVGGHKYAGNCIIHTPQGWSVWYGRVTPHNVESIVLNTILGGKILSTLFRGGSNIIRPGCSNLHDW